VRLSKTEEVTEIYDTKFVNSTAARPGKILCREGKIAVAQSSAMFSLIIHYGQ